MISNSVIKAPLKIRVQAGDTFTRQFAFTDQDAAPIDFTGYSFKLQVKDVAGNEILLWANSDFTLVSTGVYQISKSATDMDIEPDTYSYDLQVTYPSGEKRTYIFGNFEVYNQTTL